MGIHGTLEHMNKSDGHRQEKRKIIWFWVNLKIKGIYERYFNKGATRNPSAMHATFTREERINGAKR